MVWGVMSSSRTPASVSALEAYVIALQTYLRGEPVDGVHPDAKVAPGAEVRRSVLGAESSVGPGAKVVASVLLPGAVVGDDGIVERAIIGRSATVGDGARVDDLAVLGDGAMVGPRLRVSGGTVGVGEHLEVE